ncbi:type VII secretion target [Nocardia sp. NPDC005745]|uniref:type VII secretion target n=1 Tax=Nocardia sp. NPDC005745 TaxID=3157061 RepID=UPI0033ED5C87
MPNYLDVEPDQLRRIAEQHDRAAADIRKWGEIPRDWLAEFPSKYGAIADPVRGALQDYYQRRHDNAERLAANHERTRDDLLAAATALEDGDQAGKHQIGHAGDGFGNEAPAGGPAIGTPPDRPGTQDTGPDTPRTSGDQPVRSPVTTPDTPGMLPETGRSDQVPPPPVASAPRADDAAYPAATIPTGMPPVSVIIPESGVIDVSAVPSDDATRIGGSADGIGDITSSGLDANGAVGTDANGAAGMAGGMPPPVATGPFPAAVAAGIAPTMPPPLVSGPLAAAVHAAEDRRGLPSFVVGEQVGDDLVLARNLLAGTLAAVADSARGLEWAVAVGRTPIGPVVLLTSTEGRGWLPPGLFLPSEVALPWSWDAVLDGAVRNAIGALEGTADPARMLAEFGLMMRRRSVRLSALVSSAAIPPELYAALGDDVAIEGWVPAAESAVDLTSPGVGLVDRLDLGGSAELLRQAATVPATEVRAVCIELARAADVQVRTAVPSVDAKISARRAQRQRILDALHANLPIPANWWEQIRAADDAAAAALRSQQMDVSHIPVGGILPDTSGTEALRDMVFERRADELLLLLAAGEPDRQTLRDALYSYGQITEHPLFPAAARVVAAQARRPAVPDVEVARDVGTRNQGGGFTNVGSIHLDGPPPAIGELLRGPAESEGSSEQRRV